jgi:hypothetical protein
VLYAAWPSLFDVGGPPTALGIASVTALAAGVAIWVVPVGLSTAPGLSAHS